MFSAGVVSMRNPALRFKDDVGQNYPDWGKFSFFNLLDDIWDYRGKTPTKLGMEWGGSIPSLSANNVKKGYIDFNAECNLGSEELYQKWMVKGDLSKNDIVFTMEAPLGNVALIPDEKKYILSQRVVVFKTKNWIENKFFLQILLSDNFQVTVDALATGTTAKGINQKSLSKVVLEIPIEKSEQTKIANFLTAVDEKISQLTQKHDLLTQYKKGVMQQIFSQELRFKDDDGGDFPDWEERKLADLVEKIGSGGTPKSTNTEYYDGNIPWVSIADMTSSGKFILDTKRKITTLGLKESSARLYPVGVVLFAMYASIGEVAIAKVPVTTSQAILGIQPKNELMLSEYLYFWLLSLKDKIVLMGQQGTQSNLNLDIVKNFIISVPSISEQTKITDFFTSIDDKIIATQSQLQAVKQYKQGLLQQMFV